MMEWRSYSLYLMMINYYLDVFYLKVHYLVRCMKNFVWEVFWWALTHRKFKIKSSFNSCYKVIIALTILKGFFSWLIQYLFLFDFVSPKHESILKNVMVFIKRIETQTSFDFYKIFNSVCFIWCSMFCYEYFICNHSSSKLLHVCICV